MHITGRVMTAVYILERPWDNCKGVTDLFLWAIKGMTEQEMQAIKYYSEHGSFIGLENK